MESKDYQHMLAIYQAKARTSGSERTFAIRDAFVDSLRDHSLDPYRPDELWTSLQNIYYEAECRNAITSFQGGQISA